MKKNQFQQKAEGRLKRQASKKAQPKQAKEATEETTERKAAKPNQEKQELFRGAGALALDWAKISGDDFDNKVEPWLEEVGDTGEQLELLRSLKVHFEYECNKIVRQIREAERQAPYHPLIDEDYRSRRYVE